MEPFDVEATSESPSTPPRTLQARDAVPPPCLGSSAVTDPQSSDGDLPTTKSLFLELPNEMLLLIIKAGTLGVKRGLSQTCKRMHDLAYPYCDSSTDFFRISIPYCLDEEVPTVEVFMRDSIQAEYAKLRAWERENIGRQRQASTTSEPNSNLKSGNIKKLLIELEAGGLSDEIVDTWDYPTTERALYCYSSSSKLLASLFGKNGKDYADCRCAACMISIRPESIEHEGIFSREAVADLEELRITVTVPSPVTQHSRISSKTDDPKEHPRALKDVILRVLDYLRPHKAQFALYAKDSSAIGKNHLSRIVSANADWQPGSTTRSRKLESDRLGDFLSALRPRTFCASARRGQDSTILEIVGYGYTSFTLINRLQSASEYVAPPQVQIQQTSRELLRTQTQPKTGLIEGTLNKIIRRRSSSLPKSETTESKPDGLDDIKIIHTTKGRTQDYNILTYFEPSVATIMKLTTGEREGAKLLHLHLEGLTLDQFSAPILSNLNHNGSRLIFRNLKLVTNLRRDCKVQSGEHRRQLEEIKPKVSSSWNLFFQAAAKLGARAGEVEISGLTRFNKGGWVDASLKDMERWERGLLSGSFEEREGARPKKRQELSNENGEGVETERSSVLGVYLPLR